MKRATIRKHIREEKRLIRLLYRTGNLDFIADYLDSLYWESYYGGLPMAFYATYDSYGGDYSENCVTAVACDILWWDLANKLCDADLYRVYCADENPLAHNPVGDVLDILRKRGRRWLIKWLRQQPVKHGDHSINAVLRCCKN